MKAKLLISLFALLGFMGARAQESTRQLVVWMKTGEKVYYSLGEKPETTFEDGKLVIKTTRTTVFYQLENVLRYTYEGTGNPVGIDLQLSERSISVSEEGDAVTLRNLREGSVVSLYGTDGMLLEQRTSQNAQPITVSVARQPSGVYIVKCGSETIKLMKP